MKCVRRDWEISANGVDMGHVHHGQLELETERELIQRARESLTNSSGKRIAGWHSPGHSQSANTLMLLAESGFEYVTDWANDDVPYMMKTTAGPLCAMPLTYEWSDRVLLVQSQSDGRGLRSSSMAGVPASSCRSRAARGGRILSLSVSPWILGYPHRIRALERILGKIWTPAGSGTKLARRSLAHSKSKCRRRSRDVKSPEGELHDRTSPASCAVDS